MSLVMTAIKLSIVLTVFGLGLHATMADATSLFRQPSKLASSLTSMIVVMPAFAIVLATLFDLNPAVRLALGALAISPLPPLWPKRALNAGGSSAFTIGLLAAVSLLTIVTIPIAMKIYERAFDISLVTSAGAVAKLALQTTLLPLAVGIGVRRIVPAFAERAARPTMLLATLLLVAASLPILIKLWPEFGRLVGDGTLVAMTAFVIVGVVVGHLLGGPHREERTTLALATSSRHPAIALTLAMANAPPSNQRQVPAAILLYLILSAIVSLPYFVWAKKQGPVQEFAPPSGRHPRTA